MKIIDNTNEINQKWSSKTKERKLDCKLLNVKMKQESEYNGFNSKMRATLDEFDIKRKEECDT